MNKSERLYRFSMEKGVVDVEDLKAFADEQLNVDYKYLYSKFITRLLSEGKLVRIKRGLYAAKNVYDPEERDVERYLVASKIKSDYYLGYHTALEVHGAAYSEFNSVHVAVPRNSYFNAFDFEGVMYMPVTRNNNDIETETQNINRKKQSIRISTASRTFVDCIDRYRLCGGYEEILKSLEGLGNVNLQGVLDILDIYSKDILCRAVGYILSLMIDKSPYYGGFTENDLDPIKDRIKNNKRYLVKKSHSKYIEKWKLYVPKDFENNLVGVR